MAFAVGASGKHLRSDLFELNVEHEVAIRQILFGAKGDATGGGVAGFDADGVRRRGKFGDVQNAVYEEVESRLMMERGVLAKAWQKHVSEFFGRQFELALSRRGERGFGARMIGRRQSERKPEPETIIAQLDACQDFEINAYGLARPDIAHVEIDQAIAVLARERGERTSGDSFLVGLHCFLGFP